MRKRKTRNKGEIPKLEMTPMIDVVFQLLIFFVVSLKQEDLLSRLDIVRPSAPTVKTDTIELLEITIYKEGYVLKGRRVTIQELDRQLSRLATFSTQFSVVIKCTGDSPHSYLVKLLDVCAKSKLTNLNVFSM